MFPLMSQLVLLLLEFWVHAFLEFAEDLVGGPGQYSYPTLSSNTRGHNWSLTSSPESSGSAIEAQLIKGRAPYNLFNMAAACQEISASVIADISLVIVLYPRLFIQPVPKTSPLSQHYSFITISLTQTFHHSKRNAISNNIIQSLLPPPTFPRTSTILVHSTSSPSWPHELLINE